MKDEFDTPEPKVKRDRYGRYMLPDPTTGKEQSWTRVTTFAKTLTDEFGLTLWKERMVAKGIALRPDLSALVAGLDVKADSKQLNKITEQAKEAAGATAAANLGTAIHTFTELADTGRPMDAVPPPYRADVAAYSDALEEAGIRVIPGMVERITCVPEFGTAGTLDRGFLLADGRSVIGDVKTGKDLSYNWLEICVQLSLYQIGVSMWGVFDLSAGTWDDPIYDLDAKTGIVAHIPAGSGGCTLYEVDLEAGRRFAELALAVRAARSTKNLSKVFNPAPVRDWEGEFSSVITRDQARRLYMQAKTAPEVGPGRLEILIQLGRTALTDRV